MLILSHIDPPRFLQRRIRIRGSKACFKPDRQSRHSISGSFSSIQLPACENLLWLFDFWKDLFTCYALSWTRCEEQSDSAVRWPWSLQRRSSPKKIWIFNPIVVDHVLFQSMSLSFVSSDRSSCSYDVPLQYSQLWDLHAAQPTSSLQMYTGRKMLQNYNTTITALQQLHCTVHNAVDILLQIFNTSTYKCNNTCRVHPPSLDVLTSILTFFPLPQTSQPVTFPEGSLAQDGKDPWRPRWFVSWTTVFDKDSTLTLDVFQITLSFPPGALKYSASSSVLP